VAAGVACGGAGMSAPGKREAHDARRSATTLTPGVGADTRAVLWSSVVTSTAEPMTTSSVSPPALRREALRDALPATVQSLKDRRAAEIDESLIDDYVALNWLEWNGGGLRLTTTGDNVCRQLSGRAA